MGRSLLRVFGLILLGILGDKEKYVLEWLYLRCEEVGVFVVIFYFLSVESFYRKLIFWYFSFVLSG